MVFRRNELEGIESIEVIDEGAGIAFEDLDETFGKIGGSRKPRLKENEDGRALHGSEGRGRFKALRLGTRAKWTTVYVSEGQHKKYELSIKASQQGEWEASEPVEVSDSKTGTRVVVDDLMKDAAVAASEATRNHIMERFAYYLRAYPGVRLRFDGELIRWEDLVERSETLKLPAAAGESDPAELEIVEWMFKPDHRKIHFCDRRGVAWGDTLAGVQAPGMNLAAFVSFDNAKGWHDENRYTLGELDPDLKELLNSVKSKLREYRKMREAEKASGLVEQWKAEDVYPYSEDEPNDVIHTAERQVFDIVAARVNDYHEPFEGSAPESKRFTFRLMREAISTNPTGLTRILGEVLRLPEQQRADLAELLESTDLTSIVRAAKTVDDRLKALAGFEEILFEKDWRRTLLERTQLHRLLVRHVWIFGEEYVLDTDDEPLNSVLQKHIHMLGREDIAPEVDPESVDGLERIPDLMLSRKFKRDRSEFEHLILELKRPKLKVGRKEVEQIKDYADTVASDSRFSKTHARWMFILLANEVDDKVQRDLKGSGLEDGYLHKLGNISIRLRLWADVLHEAKSRYSFFSEQLQLEAGSAAGLQHLKDRYPELLSGRGLTKKQDLAQQEEASRESAEESSDSIN